MKTVKEILWVVFFTLVFVSSYHLALGVEIPYRFATTDISVPGFPNSFAWPVDLADDGTLLLRASANGQLFTLIAKPNNARNNKINFNKAERFDCGKFTEPESINNLRRVVGNCDQGAFLREPDGSYVILSALPQAGVWNISTDHYVHGAYCTPNTPNPANPANPGCTGHGFTWSAQVGYQTIDFPLDPQAYPIRTQRLIGRDGRGQIVGDYDAKHLVGGVFLPDANFWLYDNGSFGLPFPSVMNQTTDQAYDFYDINDLGQLIGARYDGTIFLYDDGVFYDVKLPAGWLFAGLGGLNNLGQFVGTYRKVVGTTPNGVPISEWHGFVASPN